MNALIDTQAYTSTDQAVPGPRSVEMLTRMRSVIGRASYSGLYGITLTAGVGCYIEDVDGNRYLDCLSAASSCSLGYGQQVLIDAYQQAAERLPQSCFLYSPNEYAIQLAEKLLTITPGSDQHRVMLGLSGSDASGGAVKAVRAWTRNQTIIHFKNDYHGSTGLSQAASTFGNLNEGIIGNSPNFLAFDFPDTPAQATRTLDAIRHCLTRQQAGGILCEAIQGDAGVRVPPTGFLAQLRAVTQETETLLVIDEVQSGMGRTGRWWSYEHAAIQPDIFVTAKGLGGGYVPVSAVIGRQDVLDALNPGQHVFTYGGHAASAAVACAVIDYIEAHDLLASAEAVGAFLLAQLTAIQCDFPDVVVAVRGIGLMIGLEINVSSFGLAGKVFATRCVEKGVYVGFFGVNAEVVRIEPPLIMTIADAQLAIDVIREVASEMQLGQIPARTITNVHTYSIGI